MAETNSTISGTVLFETDDDLSETNLGATDAQGNNVDYVVRGCGFSVNHTNDTITIGSTGTKANYAIIEDPSNHVAHHVYPDQATDIALPNASATCHVFIDYDPSTDTAEYHIDDDDTAPSEPSLKIGTVDTANDTSTETNRAPTITTEGITSDSITDGSTRSFITADETDESSQYAGFEGIQRTTGVSTSATTIWNMDLAASPTGDFGGGGVIAVSGRRQGSTERFTDLVHLSRENTPGVVNSIDTSTPDGRTYTRSVGNIQLAMAANTYNVLAIGTSGWTQN